MDFFQAVRKRRSIYTLSGQSTLEEKEILDFLDLALANSPSAFNCQTARLLAALGESHKKIWDIARKALKEIIPSEKFPPTEAKIKSFAKGFGTILFFEETKTISEMQTRFPAYRENFPLWSQQANGMLQYIVWTGFAALGMAANLQHYNPLIDGEIAKTFKIPPSWKLVAQMPFGISPEQAPAKEIIPPAQRLKVYR